jgi:hypothetical protein
VDDDDDDDVYNDDNVDDNDDNDDNDDSPPGKNDSLSFNIDAFWKGYNPSWRQLKKRHEKGGEKRSRSNIVNVARGCNLPPPHLAQGRSRSRSGSNDARVEQGSKAPSPPKGEEEERIECLHGRAGEQASTPPSKLKRK